MNPFEVIFHAKGAAEIRGLPAQPSRELYDVLVEISRDPWGQTKQDPVGGDPSFRYALFDNKLGIVHLRVDEQARAVTVHGITWIG